MNLTSLFNFDYLLQNIKKSKMAILLFLLIVPLFTALTLIVALDNYAIEFWELGMANIIFMYVTPFILSFCLFGYVFKKKEIDFVGSMPISRKTIYFTNTLGGIVLIIISQFITLLVSLLLGSLTDVIVFPAMVLDMFLYQTLGYIFVFSISNLAMSVSGNVITQIVTSLLIVAVVPAFTFYFDVYNHGRYDLMDGDYKVNENYIIRMMREYTAPCSPLAAVVDSEWEYGATTMSCVKMIVLSVLYIAIGYIMFEKKKLENAGESFEKNTTHFIVKALTLIPFGMVLYPVIDEEEWGISLFLLGVIAVYYLIYDLATNKKNKFWLNMGLMCMSIVITSAACAVIAKVAEEVEFKIDLKDVKSITINSFKYNIDALDFTIEDEVLVQQILFGADNEYRYYGSGYEDKFGVRILATINMNNGSKKRTAFSLNKDLTDTILKGLNTEEHMVDNIDYNEQFNFTKDEIDVLKTAINDIISGDGLYTIYNLHEKYSSLDDNIKTYKYVNHKIRMIEVPIYLNDEVFGVVTKAQNASVVDFVRKRINTEVNINIYNQGNNLNYYGGCPDKLKEFIISSGNVACELDKAYVSFYVEGNRFFTNEVNEVVKIIKGSSEYKDYMDGRDIDAYYKYYWDDMNGNTVIYEPQPIPETVTTSFPETNSSVTIESF